MLDTIAKLRKNRIDHLSSVQQQKKDAEKEVLEARAKINKHLDHIQATIMQELDDIETKMSKQTDKVLASLNENENQLNDYQATISIIKQYATDLQAFLSIKRVDNDVASKEYSLHKLINTDVMNNTTLSCEIDKVVQNLTTNISTLGNLIVRNISSEITISRKKNKQAQIMVVTNQPSAIENIKLKLQQTIKTKGKDITGSVLLPDGRMVFSCYDGNSVRSINKDGSQDFDIGTGKCTFDVTYKEDTNTIAVTSGGSVSQCISIIDMRNGKVQKTIPVKSKCYGIVFRNNTLIYSTYDKGLRMVNISDNSVIDIVTSQIAYAYVATFRDKVYYTNKDTHTMTCCDLQGKIQWQFKDESILKTPLGITVDNDGNVYVVGDASSNVVVISSDGLHRRQLLSKEDGLDEPQVLHYENSTNRLLVANRRSIARLYQVTKS